jgi:ribosome modulation factor
MTLDEILAKDYPKGKRWGMGAFVKGWNAAQSGNARDTCPYPDHYNSMGVTFSRGYRRAWFKGFDCYQKSKE